MMLHAAGVSKACRQSCEVLPVQFCLLLLGELLKAAYEAMLEACLQIFVDG
jgi:hypothetical protein